MKLGQSTNSRVLLMYLAQRLRMARRRYDSISVLDNAWVHFHAEWLEANNSFYGAKRVIAEMERTW